MQSVGSDKSNCCLDVNSHCAWTGDACVEIENLGGNTDQCGVDDSGGSSNLPPCAGVGTDKSNCCLDVNSHCAWTGDVCVEIENLGANTDQCGVDDSGGSSNLPPCAGVGTDKSNCCLDVNSHCAWTGDVCVEIENLGANTDQCDSSGGDGGGGSVDLSSSTCADTQYPGMCVNEAGDFNPTKSLAGLDIDCSGYDSVAYCTGVTEDNLAKTAAICCDAPAGSYVPPPPPCAAVGSDKSNCCTDSNSHCAWTGDACVEIENLGGNTDQCGVDDSLPILNTCAETIQYLSAHGSNSNEVCMSMVGQDNFDGSKVIDIGGQGLDCDSGGYNSIAECIEDQSGIMFTCCGYVHPPPGSVDLSSSTCADIRDPELCSGRDGSLNSDKSLYYERRLLSLRHCW